MRISAQSIEKTRLIALLVTSLACFSYAALALVQGRPDPMLWWIPGAFGLGAAALICAVAFLAGRSAAEAATDELYKATSRRAASLAYWLSLAFFALVAALVAFGLADWNTAYAVLGTAMGGSYLALFVWLDWRAGR